MPNVDPTIEFVPIEIEGKTYQMCFDLGALCDAEEALMAQGVQARLLQCLEVADLTGNAVRTLFALSLRKAQPDLEYEAARALVTHKNLQLVRSVILAAWVASVAPEEDEGEKKTENETAAETNENTVGTESGSGSGASPTTT